MRSDELPYWLLANSIWWISWPIWQSALHYFGDWKTMFQSSDSDRRACGFTIRQIASMRQQQSIWSEHTVTKWLHEAPCRDVVTLADPRYPASLKEIYDPPLALYAAGNISLLSERQIAVVGARRASFSGKNNAFKMSAELTRHGLTVISGLAAGIDHAAHEGALSDGGKTIGVAGTGLLNYYPPSSRKLIERLMHSDHGLVISEYDLTLGARKEHFPRRNRIIAGMSEGVLVIEAACRSGSLITAHLANEYGRDVFAMPGSVDHEYTRGCHALIKNGARLVESAEDVLVTLRVPTLRLVPTPQQEEIPLNWGADDKTIYHLLSKTFPTSLDQLVMKSGLTVTRVSSILMELELSNWVDMSSGGFTRIK